MSTDDKREAHMAAVWAVGFSVAAIFLIVMVFKHYYPDGVHARSGQAAQVAATQEQSSMSTPDLSTYVDYPDTLIVGGTTLRVSLATTSAQRSRGLSGRSELLEGTGMLFVFSEPAQYSFWMKDMNFSIDIVWVNARGVVIDITTDASPASFPTTFVPSGPVTYVLEVPAGYTSRAGINIGDTISPLPVVT